MTEKLIVMHSNGEKEAFRPRIIGNTIMKETNIDEELAEKIQNRIVQRLYKLKKDDGLKEISTSAIRAEVSHHLLNEGEFEAEEDSRKLGLSVKEFEDLLENGCKDNANMTYNPEMIAKYSWDAIAKQYALLTMPPASAKAYTDGYLHHADMEYYNTRSNCFIYDMRKIIRNGLQVPSGSYAKPPKHLDTLLSLLSENFMAHGGFLSGGAAYNQWNVYAAPFAKGLTYSECKQCVQAFIFDANQSLVSKGSQLIFSSLNIEISVPDFMMDLDAWGPGGVINGKYSDYVNEAEMLTEALLEVIEEGDGHGKPHVFPNFIFALRREFIDHPLMKKLHQVIAKCPTPYLANMERDNVNKLCSTMGCRTCAIDSGDDWENEVQDFGNFSYSTISLPLIAYENKNDKDGFYKELDKYLEIVYETLLDRKEKIRHALYDLHISDFLLTYDEYTDTQLYNFEKLSYSFGVVGLNEMCLNFFGKDITSQEGHDFAIEVLEYINKYANKCKEETGLKFNVLSSPAESLSGRLARVAKQKYPDLITQGTGDGVYFTNSHHINVSNECDLTEHFDNANDFNPLTPAGSICHIFCDGNPNPDALYDITKKLMETNISFFAFSTVFITCNDCGHMVNNNLDACPFCGSENILKWDRITGYTRPISSFGANKANEFKDRYRHNLN